MSGKHMVKLEDRSKRNPFNRLPDHIRQRADHSAMEQQMALNNYMKSHRSRHFKLLLFGVFIYIALGYFMFDPVSKARTAVVLTLLGISGGGTAFIISAKELGTLWSVFVFGTPAVALTLLNSFIIFVPWYPMVAFPAWVFYAIIGAAIGHYVDNFDYE